MAQRLVLACVSTFVSSSKPGVASLVITILCTAALAVHMRAAPLHNSASQLLQSVLLVCLIAVSVCSVPFATALEAATVPTQSTPSDDLAHALDTVFRYAAPIAAIAAAYTTPMLSRVVKIKLLPRIRGHRSS